GLCGNSYCSEQSGLSLFHFSLWDSSGFDPFSRPDPFSLLPPFPLLFLRYPITETARDAQTRRCPRDSGGSDRLRRVRRPRAGSRFAADAVAAAGAVLGRLPDPRERG